MSEVRGSAGAVGETSQANPSDAAARGPYHAAEGRSRRASGFLPLLLVGLAVLGWTVFQTVELIGEHHSLIGLHTAQQPQVMQSEHLRASLNTLASDTQRLADRGDAGAQVIVEQLKKRGVTIHPGS